MDYVNAFWVGGLICAAVQILLDRTKLMPGRVMVLLVCTGAVLGAVKVYQPFQDFAGAGASVPLTGFGNLLWKGVKEAVDKEGFIGIFLGGFKASAVGISAALIFSYLASLVFDPKLMRSVVFFLYMKKNLLSWGLDDILKMSDRRHNDHPGSREDPGRIFFTLGGD